MLLEKIILLIVKKGSVIKKCQSSSNEYSAMSWLEYVMFSFYFNEKEFNKFYNCLEGWEVYKGE